MYLPIQAYYTLYNLRQSTNICDPKLAFNLRALGEARPDLVTITAANESLINEPGQIPIICAVATAKGVKEAKEKICKYEKNLIERTILTNWEPHGYVQ